MENRLNTVERSLVIKEVLKAEDACLSGFADVSNLGLPITQKYPYSICFAVQHDDATVNQLPNDNLWMKMSSSLSEKAGQTYSAIQSLIESWGYRYSRIPSSTRVDELPDPGEELPQKTLATLSGLGWIGRSTLLVTSEFGPRIRLGTLLTNMPLQINTPVVYNSCGNCYACVEACPVGAIRGNSWSQGTIRKELLDLELCYNHLWRKKETLGRRLTCGICLKVCPIGQSE